MWWGLVLGLGLFWLAIGVVSLRIPATKLVSFLEGSSHQENEIVIYISSPIVTYIQVNCLLN